jgi:hypothetical protein
MLPPALENRRVGDLATIHSTDNENLNILPLRRPSTSLSCDCTDLQFNIFIHSYFSLSIYFFLIPSLPSNPLQHPITGPRPRTRRITQPSNSQHLTRLIISPSTRNTRAIKSQITDTRPHTQYRHISKRI